MIEQLRNKMAAERRTIDALLEQTAEMRAKREALRKEQLAATRTLQGMTAQINAVQQPELREAKKRLAKLARAEQALREAGEL